MQFKDIITSHEALREILPQSEKSLAKFKQINHIDSICAQLIAVSPFVIIASKGGDGLMELSPKGDPAGFVQVLDKHHLAVPDRLGNHRLDTFNNLLENPAVGMIFLIPGHTDTLRVAGTGMIVRDESVRARFEINCKIPELVLVVRVEEAFVHCSKCIRRSKLWQPEHWPELPKLPTLAQAMIAHGKLALEESQMDAIIETDAKERLY